MGVALERNTRCVHLKSFHGGRHTLSKGAEGTTTTSGEEVEAKRVSESTVNSEATTQLGLACDSEKRACAPPRHETESHNAAVAIDLISDAA